MFDLKQHHVTAVAPVISAICASLIAGLIPLPADAQIQITPQRPTQSNVQYFDFEWYHKDIDIGPEADTDAADSFELESIGDRMARSFPRFDFNADATDDIRTQQRPRRHGVADYRAAAPPPRLTDFPDPGDEAPTRPPAPDFDGDDPDATDDNDDYDEVFESSDLDDKTGGVRLYFYERERPIAERASAFIQTSYRELVDDFDFVPSTTLPYILYNSYQEFLQTNIFPVQEGVLGVTGRADLQLVLPYFGDHRLFQHISTHEMVHQFQIQKAREVAQDAGMAGDPMDQMPLWFIEGMAEYYSLDGLDDEAEMLTRDLLLNPDPQRGLVMLDFFEDRPRSQLWTYKIGQARVAFLEDVYGEGTIQEVFNQSYRLLGSRSGRQGRSFRSLLAEITGDDRRRIADRFEAWIKERSYTNYLDSRQDSPQLEFYDELRGLMQTMKTSDDGAAMMYRSIQRSTGQVRLYIGDTEDPDEQRRVASDGRPGVESLHPVGPRNFDVGDEQLTFVARAAGHDILYLQDFDHQRPDDNGGDARIRLGDRQGFELRDYGLLAAESPAFSPNGRRVAFIGLDDDGEKNLFVLEPLQDGDFIVTQLTDSPHAERGLAWSDDGLLFTSDATGHGRYNLFRIDLEEGTGEPQRLTFEERDHFDPHMTDDGRVLFSAYENTRSNLYEYTDDGILQRTDVVTGLFDVSSGADDALWATYQHRGQRRVVRLDSDDILDDEVSSPDDDPRQVAEYPSRSLDGAERYRVTDLENWQLSNIFGVLGASSGGIFGQLMLMTNDRLRNHALFVNIFAFGDLDNTVADILYLNQSGRLIWGAGLFQDVRYRLDRSLQDNVGATTGDRHLLLSGERFYGARATLRYPFNRFSFIQGDLAVGGTTFFMLNSTRRQLDRIEENYPSVDDAESEFVNPWLQQHDEHRFQTSPSMSLGYNTIRYHPGTGPIDGTSALLQGTVDVQPFQRETHGTVRLDAERYFPIYDRINLSLRFGTGSAFGGPLARQFLLSSFDTLRGVDFNNFNYLLGNQFLFSKLELRFPLNFLVRIPLIDVEGIIGTDFGGAGQNPLDVWRSRSLAPVTGLNFGLGPLVFRLHFARPIDIGAQYPTPTGSGDSNWITNFSLGWRYW